MSLLLTIFLMSLRVGFLYSSFSLKDGMRVKKKKEKKVKYSNEFKTLDASKMIVGYRSGRFKRENLVRHLLPLCWFIFQVVQLIWRFLGKQEFQKKYAKIVSYNFSSIQTTFFFNYFSTSHASNFEILKYRKWFTEQRAKEDLVL